MLLLLSFLLSSRAGTCALPILLSRFSEASIENPVFDVTTTASTGACAGRSLWDILWSCLATTFACTWVSVHPNIPFLRESKSSTRRWRVYLMLISLIAPEIMILWACKQLQGALVIMKTVNSSYWVKVLEKDWVEFKTETKTVSQEADRVGKAAKELKRKEKDNSPLWTLTHAQYLQMGGYRLQCLTSEEKSIPSRYGRVAKAMFAGGERDVWELPLSFETMKAAFNEGYIDIPFIRKDEILDKNGRDGLSKTIAMLQLTWFIIQIAARIRQGLAVTELELTTAALACLNIAMYISWWSKPTDIMCPTIVTTKGLQRQDRRWMRKVSLPSSPSKTTQHTNGARASSSSPPDPELHYVITQVGDKKEVNLATHYWDEFTKALHDSLKFIVESPAKLVTGLLRLASELGEQIRGIWAHPSPPSDHKSTSEHNSATEDLHSRSPSDASQSSSYTTFIKKVRETISLIWITVTHLFLALIYYPVLAILRSGRKSKPKSNGQRKSGSGKEHEHITAKDVEDKTTIQLIFSRRALRFVMDMVFFCEDVASAPFFCLSAFAGAIFGMIHCLAWNFEFPSHVEQILWRTCSSVIAGLCFCIMPGIALGYILLSSESEEEVSEKSGNPDERTSSGNQSNLTSSDCSCKRTSSECSGEHASPERPGGNSSPKIIRDQNCPRAALSEGKEETAEKSEVPDESTSSGDQSKLTASDSPSKPPPSESPGKNNSTKIIEVACSLFAICFVLTRISLISLSLIGLRALPASAFETVQWSGFIPHI